MIWVSWRQQRTEALIAAGILAVLAVVLIPTGIEMAHAYDHDGLSACHGQTTSESCGQAVGTFTARFESLSNLLGWLTLVPGLVGVLLAAPFVLELESGTYRLAWTQSITRRRWIASKLGLAVVVAVLVALALTLLMTWWRTPFVHLQGRMENGAFDSEGSVVFGYVLFALGLAVAAGVVWRRAVPALVVAFGVYFAVRLFVDTWLRQRLIAPLSATWRLDSPGPNLNRAWVLDQYPSDALGHRAPIVARPVGACARAFASHDKTAISDCLARHGQAFTTAVYEPASRFWAFQGIETALFGGVGLLLIAVAAWWTHERTG